MCVNTQETRNLRDIELAEAVRALGEWKKIAQQKTTELDAANMQLEAFLGENLETKLRDVEDKEKQLSKAQVQGL